MTWRGGKLRKLKEKNMSLIGKSHKMHKTATAQIARQKKNRRDGNKTKKKGGGICGFIPL